MEKEAKNYFMKVFHKINNTDCSLSIIFNKEKISLHIIVKWNISKESDPLLHSAVHDAISCELNLPPMSSFMTRGFTELLKLDLEPWKVDDTSVARLPPVPTAGASVS